LLEAVGVVFSLVQEREVLSLITAAVQVVAAVKVGAVVPARLQQQAITSTHGNMPT